MRAPPKKSPTNIKKKKKKKKKIVMQQKDLFPIIIIIILNETEIEPTKSETKQKSEARISGRVTTARKNTDRDRGSG